ncbi:MAG: FtsX-like permease family protein [Peptococcaceae bacterium]|nr:FtsX-like permease family protein [Peptococcaceae bacterium]
MFVVVGASLIILSLLITLFLRDRKHEIGVYLSLGERKTKVVVQIALEVVVVALIAITLSLFSGNILAGSISEKMLVDQVAAEQGKKSNNGYVYTELEYMGYRTEIDSNEVARSYAVSLDLITMLLFYAVGIGTVSLSTLMPIAYISRLNPKKILM